MAEKQFTLQEAERTLPFVRRVVADIVESYRGLQQRVRDYNSHVADAGEDSEEARSLRTAMERDARRIDGYVEELQALGCQFKGFDDGLVDYPGSFEGRPILLCWKLGEDRIGWWHDLEAGYAGRQPITDAMARALNGG